MQGAALRVSHHNASPCGRERCTLHFSQLKRMVAEAHHTDSVKRGSRAGRFNEKIEER